MTPSTPPEIPFGQLLRDTREAKGITLRKFAQIVDLSATYVSKIERGEMAAPGEETIKRIAKVLEIDEDELLGLAGKVSTDLKDIILEHPKAVANFLRTIHGKSEAEIQRATQQLNKDAKDAP
jgi:transcriptional regulator with XRE-family HTH domain